MAAWWQIDCEYAHYWEVLIEDDSEPTEEQLTCPEDGLPAVVAMRRPLADRCVIRLVPVTWEREGSTGHEGEFLLEVSSSLDPTTVLRSREILSWEQVKKYLELLHGIPWEQARARWLRFPALGRNA